ncbi:MAG: class I SAM-dependent methyltransferase, partial [Oscillospiraceae bacterium]
MNKYDVGYEITDTNSTYYWVCNKIPAESRVLEFGSSNGILTKNLAEKGCIVDIVEIDQKSGEQAAKFANRSLIGPTQGNIENNIWCDELKDEKYDYIVFLDVLEHLYNPMDILIKCKGFLKDNGSILLSVPNIAHNSIIINLINNKFEYTKLGLLDDTHIRFFAYDTVCKMVEDSGYCAIEKKALQNPVSSNEIKNNYGDVPSNTAGVLRVREFADVYQFIFELKKGEFYTSNDVLHTTNLNASLYQSVIFIKEKDDECFSEGKTLRYYIDPNKVSIALDFSGFPNATQIRIDPLEVSCILKNIKLYTNKAGLIEDIIIKEHNGVIDENGSYIFGHNDPQLIIDVEACRDNILNFEYESYLFDNDGIPLIANLNEHKGSLQLQLEETSSANTNLQLQ